MRTGFARDEPGILNTLIRIAAPLFTSPEGGADTSLHLATHADGATHHGAYFVRRRPVRPSRRG